MRGLMMDSQLTITSIMEFALRNHPDTEVLSVTHDHYRFRYTLADCFRRVAQLAHVLADADAGPGDVIGTLAWNDHRHLELYYGIGCSGMVCHTINPRLQPEQLVYTINHAEDRLIFVDPSLLPLLEPLLPQLHCVQEIIILGDESSMPETSVSAMKCYETLLAAKPDQFDYPAIDEREASSLCYTSGTTGDPKGVLYDHRSTVLHAYASSLPNATDLSRQSVVMPLVPMFHVNSWGLPYSAVMAGAKLVFPGPYLLDGAELTRLINEEEVIYASGVPTIFNALLDYLDSEGATIPSLERVAVGGAACPLSLMEAFEDRYGVYMHAAWGMTELSPMGTINPGFDRNAMSPEEYARKRQKAGRGIYGIEMKIVDDNDRELPWDGIIAGHLKVRGPWVCKAYYKREHSEAHDASGWFDTGDVATIDGEGLMQVTDRVKDVIKSGGEWISSIELENVATAHPSVAEAAVIAMPHPKWTERPLLLVTIRDGHSFERGAILESFHNKVARWWIPDDCVVVDTLPHTSTGKLDKKALRETFRHYCFPATKEASTHAEQA